MGQKGEVLVLSTLQEVADLFQQIGVELRALIQMNSDADHVTSKKVIDEDFSYVFGHMVGKGK